MATFPALVSPSRTTCASLRRQLQVIWDEIGEEDGDKDMMLQELEQQCLDIYRRKVDSSRKHKAELAQSLADGETEIADLVSALGETASFPQRVKGSLKQQLSALKPALQDLRQRKQARMIEFHETQLQIAQICAEIEGNDINTVHPTIDECDLTLKRLGELKSHLKELQTEKNLHLHKVSSSIGKIHELSVVMSIDVSSTVADIHPSLSDRTQSMSISNGTLARLTKVIQSLRQEKLDRLRKLQDLGKTLMGLWDLLDTNVEEQEKFDHVTSLVSSSLDEALRKGCLAFEVIEQTEIEVERLNALKASKMKELVLKRQNELEAIYRDVHMDIDTDGARQTLINLIESGNVELSELLSSMDNQIANAKELALSRRDVLDKVEKWKHAYEEEKWLEDYEKEAKRYSAGRGAHDNLERAEKARILISKIPSMVKSLTSEVKSWELERGRSFEYDKDPLLRVLEKYTATKALQAQVSEFSAKKTEWSAEWGALAVISAELERAEDCSRGRLILLREDHLARKTALLSELDDMAVVIRAMVVELYRGEEADLAADVGVDGAADVGMDGAAGEEEALQDLEADLRSWRRHRAEILRLINNPPADARLANLIDR